MHFISSGCLFLVRAKYRCHCLWNQWCNCASANFQLVFYIIFLVHSFLDSYRSLRLWNDVRQFGWEVIVSWWIKQDILPLRLSLFQNPFIVGTNHYYITKDLSLTQYFSLGWVGLHFQFIEIYWRFFFVILVNKCIDKK